MLNYRYLFLLVACACLNACSEKAAPFRFAVIGDFGTPTEGSRQVANLINGWKPDLIITVGDNNYPIGSAETIDANIGQYFHTYISPYRGQYGSGASANRFFPSLGNHDWDTDPQPYFDYFNLPNNERYYDFVYEKVHFFCLNSNETEPDGISSSSKQALWLQQRLAETPTHLNVIFFHHAPYTSSSVHTAATIMRWPFKEWGADIVLTGHNHFYERLVVDGLPFIVNGSGGKSHYEVKEPAADSQFINYSDYGAQRVDVSESGSASFVFATVDGSELDTLAVFPE